MIYINTYTPVRQRVPKAPTSSSQEGKTCTHKRLQRQRWTLLALLAGLYFHVPTATAADLDFNSDGVFDVKDYRLFKAALGSHLYVTFADLPHGQSRSLQIVHSLEEE